jgi:hypothetical protein
MAGLAEEHVRIALRRVMSITANRRLMSQLKRNANKAIQKVKNMKYERKRIANVIFPML